MKTTFPPVGSIPPTLIAALLTFRFENDSWICAVAGDGRKTPLITFDPFSEQWINVQLCGSYGVLRSREGWQRERIAFLGLMTMIGIDTEWRMTWTKMGNDQFSFTNEERLPDGSWVFI